MLKTETESPLDRQKTRSGYCHRDRSKNQSAAGRRSKPGEQQRMGMAMKYNPEIHDRRSIRLKGYDYSQAGAYFITICTQNRKCMFGEIIAGEMRLNAAGDLAIQCWQDIPDHFAHAELDEWVIMPNHVHGIVSIVDVPPVGAKNFSPLQQPNFSPLPGTSKTIGSIVRGFKIGVTKWMRNNTPIHDVWQRNYWEHIIRNESELIRVREYIRNNPVRWELDKLNPGGDDGVGGRGKKFFAPLGIRERCGQYGHGTSCPDDEAWMA